MCVVFYYLIHVIATTNPIYKVDQYCHVNALTNTGAGSFIYDVWVDTLRQSYRNVCNDVPLNQWYHLSITGDSIYIA